jgi:hypothetical protein
MVLSTESPFDDASGKELLEWLPMHGALIAALSSFGLGLKANYKEVSINLLTEQDAFGVVNKVGFTPAGSIPLFYIMDVVETIVNSDASNGFSWVGYDSIILMNPLTGAIKGRKYTPVDYSDSSITINVYKSANDMNIGANAPLFTAGKVKIGLYYLGIS